MKRNDLIAVSIVVLTLFHFGCASVSRRTKGEDSVSSGVYPGLRGDVEAMARAFREDYRAEDYSLAAPLLDGFEVFYFPVALMDTPLSFTLDTICFPFDIIPKQGMPKEQPSLKLDDQGEGEDGQNNRTIGLP